MIWIIGGTSDARRLIERLDHSCDYVLTIATQGGRDFFDSKNLFVGRLTKEQMEEFAIKNNVHKLVDLSHPYAKIVSENAKEVCKKLDIEYIRYTRKKVVSYDSGTYFNSYEESYKYLQSISGSVFFTTGSKNIPDFEKVRGHNRFIYRILPVSESISIAEKENIHMRDIVAMVGPFSKEMNIEMLKYFQADYCVLKDSGIAGGTIEKLQACKDLGLQAIIIGRDEESGQVDIDKILEMIEC